MSPESDGQEELRPAHGLTLGCVGDILLVGPVLEMVRRLGATSMARQIWAPLQGVDVVLANLEAPVTDSTQRREDKRYVFKTRSEVLSLFDNRFVLCLANNHILDYGERGLFDTLEALETHGLVHAGAGRNLDEARRPAITKSAGVRLAAVCAADPRFQAATRTSPGTFPARPELLKESIQELRGRAELIVVSIHGGTEYLPVPAPPQLRLAELCLEEGARVVHFHHAHRLSGLHRDSRGVVFFGTGNYSFPPASSKRVAFLRESAVWQVAFTPQAEITDIVLLPVVLDNQGLPQRAIFGKGRRISGKVERYSRRIERNRRLLWWRLWEMIQPPYLWLNVANYASIARRQGVQPMLRTFAAGLKAQLR